MWPKNANINSELHVCPQFSLPKAISVTKFLVYHSGDGVCLCIYIICTSESVCIFYF